MNNPTKKIIAREGIILITIVFISYALSYILYYYEFYALFEDVPGHIFVIAGLFIRFIIWAIRALREK